MANSRLALEFDATDGRGTEFSFMVSLDGEFNGIRVCWADDGPKPRVTCAMLREAGRKARRYVDTNHERIVKALRV